MTFDLILLFLLIFIIHYANKKFGFNEGKINEMKREEINIKILGCQTNNIKHEGGIENFKQQGIN